MRVLINFKGNKGNNKGKCFVQYNNFHGVVLEILMDHKFQRLQEDLNCEPFTCHTVTSDH